MRPDGKNALYSKRPLLEILGNCSRDRLGVFQGKQIWILNISHEAGDSLKRKLTKLRVKGADLNPSEISDALLQSFPNNERYAYILSDTARRCLRNFDMQIDEETFGSARYLLDLVKELYPQIVKTHLDECIHLMKILVSEENPPIQGIIDSGVMSDLIDGMKRRANASGIHIFSRVLQDMNEDQVKAILDCGFLDGLHHYYNTLSSMKCRGWPRQSPMPLDAIKDSCKSLESLINTSVTLRDSVVKSGVLDSFLRFMNHKSLMRDDLQPYIELWQTICSSYKDSSPIDLSLMSIKAERMAPLLTSRIDLEFVASVLWLKVKNLRLSDEISIASFWSYAEPIDYLVLGSKTHDRARSVRIFYLLTELDFFGSMAEYHFSFATRDGMFELFTTSLQLTPRTIEDENLAKQACKSIGYLVRTFYCKPDMDFTSRQGGRRSNFIAAEQYLLPWVKALVKLSNDGKHLTVLQYQLLIFISKSIDEEVPIIQCCELLEKKLGNLTFPELVMMLKIGNSVQDVRDELMASLQKRTKVAIEGQIERFIKYIIEEDDVSRFIFRIYLIGMYSLIIFSLAFYPLGNI